MSAAEETLTKYFGYAHFRLNQKAIVEAVLAGKDVLATLPTGGGKSVCCQIPGLILGGTTLVISPLISLMKDQVDQLQKRNISAAYLNSTLSETEITNFFTKFTSGQYTFAYVAPERLTTPKFLAACQKVKISLVAIDEAHCISQWGHDFRPEYLRISQFLKHLTPRPLVMALTATATPKVQSEIISFSGLNQPDIFINSFKRENLSLVFKQCAHETERNLWLIRLWKKYQGQKILLYCATRAQTNHYAQFAQHFGFACQIYHAGLSSDQRNLVQHQFTNHQVTMVAATNAFGMGIDIPDIRLVIHLQVPQNVEGYYQEIGRAGRDGKAAACFLLHTVHDQEISDKVFAKQYPKSTELSRKISIQRQEFQKIITNKLCHSQAILKYFGERNSATCQQCDICQPATLKLTDTELDDRRIFWNATQHQRSTFSREFPGFISPSVIKYAALLQPKTETDWQKIPGAGKGFKWPGTDRVHLE